MTFDKSALQALNMDESVWFDTFFSANITPLFYVETLADLEKEVAAGKTPESVVGMLAAKTPTDGYPNAHHRSLVQADLMGQEIQMDGRVVIAGGDVMQAADGKVGIHVDDFPEAAALLRWRNGEFLDIERGVATGWRIELSRHDPNRMIGVLQDVLPTGAKIRDLEELKTAIDLVAESADREVVALALDVLGVPYYPKRVVLAGWKAIGRPPLNVFAPYATHVFKVDVLYYLGIHYGFISGERASHRVDVAYLYYLPFTVVFTSGDKLHHRLAPLFLAETQSYVESGELKKALREVDEHYSRLPDEIKKLGVLQFAHYPPPTMDNTITRLWDKYMRKDWREEAKRAEAEVGKSREHADDGVTLAEITDRIANAQPLAGNRSQVPSSDQADYVVIRRRVPVTKGKWRMVSKEVEEADEES